MGYIKLLILQLAMIGVVYAADSTVSQTQPAVSQLTVSDGAVCSAPGSIAKTVAGSYATCESGAWKAREISNPEYVQAYVPMGPISGNAVYAPCAPTKKILFTSCLIYGVNGPFYHDEQGPAGGIYYGFPLPGDQGAYCLYVSGAGASGALVVSGVCGDR